MRRRRRAAANRWRSVRGSRQADSHSDMSRVQGRKTLRSIQTDARIVSRTGPATRTAPA